MTIFTSSLPESLLKQLDERARQLSMPKNKIIEKALTLYLDHLKKAEYAKSYKSAADDEDILLVAEEGMIEYLSSIEASENDGK